MKSRIAALVLAALAAPVMATTTATVTAGNLGVALKDLNAADGVAPVLTWDPNWTLFSNSAFYRQTGYDFQNNGGVLNLQPIYAGASNVANGSSAPSLVLSGATLSGHGTYSIQFDGHLGLSMSMQDVAGPGDVSSTLLQFSRGFSLSAGTQVTFSMLVDRLLTGTGYTGSWTPPANASLPQQAWAAASINLYTASAGVQSSLNGSSSFTNPAPFEIIGEGDQTKLVIRNATSTDQSYTFNAVLYYSLQESLDPGAVAAVPEPTGFALMSLGLLAVGAAARRRKA